MKKVFLFILTLKIFTIYGQNFGDIDLAFPNKTSIVSDGTVECILTQPDGKILIGGQFNRPNNVKSCLIRLNSDGTTDNTFLISSFNVNNGSLFVYSIKLQSDGKIIIGGTFNTINGITKNKIARLNSDGTIDVTFNIGTGFDIDSTINKIGVKSDGKIIVGGNFSSYNGLGQNRLIVLNTDGTKDNNFNIGSGFYFSGWNGNNSASIGAIEIQLDGKIIVGGTFSQYNGLNEKDIIRLNTDGTKDSTFNIGLGFTNPEINKILIQSNGKILIGGKWDAFNNSGYNVIVRLNNDGTRDNTFNVPDNGFFYYVNDIGIDSSGKIILAGNLDTFNNSSIANHLIRLNSDGTRDNTFNLGSSFDDATNSISILANGKILVGGYFTNFNSYKQNGIIRLNNNGNVDTSFYKIWDKANFTNDFSEITIYDFSQQSDGKILVGGTFSKFNDVEQNGLIRLNIDGTKDITFNIGTGFIAYPPSLNRAGRINKILIQPDGKILVCGSFVLFNGITLPNSQSDSFNLVRLNSNGSLDTNFNIPNITYPEIALQLDGKIIGISGNSIKRFNTDGTIDNTFIASFTDASKLLVQPDGKILVGKISAGNSIDLIRLNTNGTIDTSFTNGSASSGGVQSLTYLSNGKILVGGKFNGFNTISPVGGLVRLNSNGSLDNTFNANGIAPAGFVRVLSVFVQSDGKLLVGGDDIGGGQFYWRNIIRLNSNGSNDSTNFQNIIQDYYAGTVYKIFQQNDGKILVSGQFNKYGTTESISLIRLNGSYTLEIENFNESKHINIYPNPTTNFITIDCSDNLNAIGGNYKIIDILGQEIQKGNLLYQQNTIDLNNIKGKGIYFVKIFDSLNSLLDNKKIIIQK
jgi:uncharacterized delta-60 repeat protein